ncbi:MAG: FAD-dependent oxidoreductase [Pseudomonadota bacterium]
MSTSQPNKRKHEHYDVIVVGGGMVGGAAAIGLAQRGLQVLLLEARAPKPFVADQPPDLRVSALNLGSQQLLSSLGVWDTVAGMRMNPYRRLSVWEDQGRCDFSADELGLEQIGYFVENRLLQLALLEHAGRFDNLTLVTGETVQSLKLGETAQLVLSDGRFINAKWVIAADGANSSLRQMAGIGTRGWRYAQQVLAVGVKTTGRDQDITWQQFTPSGPMAFLPMYDQFAELIWYHSPSQIERLKSLQPDALADEIRRTFPPQLDDFEIVHHASFPIQRLHAKRYWQDNLVLVGDAAHSINPLAGQGVNLGFKDVKALLHFVDTDKPMSADADLASMFRAYERRCRTENLAMMSTMDALYVGFSNNLGPLRRLRNFGLGLASRAPAAKRQVLRYAAGLN